MTAVAVPSHCPSGAAQPQDDGSSPPVSQQGLPFLWATS